MRKVLLLFALLLLPLMALYGCSGSGTGLSADTSTDTVSKTGSLTVSAKFPQNGNKGEIGTALIDENTASIEVFVETSSGSYSLSLTPASPTGTIANIPVGSLWVSIYTYDSAINMLDYLYLGGEIVEGQNTLTATLIRGSWQLVNASNQSTSITLNKTLSTDTTTLNSFSVIPYTDWYASAKKASIDPTKNFNWSEYNLLWKGSGFSSDLCGATETCQGWLGYLNQFIGPSTNNNSIADGEIPLLPTSDYTPTLDEPTNRWAFFGGGLEGMNTFSDPDVLNYFNSRVTGATTMEGNILELLTKSETGAETCYDLSDNPITCPASKSKKGLQKSITKAMSQRLGKAVADANGCFINLNVTGTDDWESCADLTGDGLSCYTYPDDWYKVVETWDWTGDACGHSFKAVGSQLPSTDLGLIVQKTKK